MSDWRPDAGYRSKTIKRGAATIIICRPELDAQEKARRETQAREQLESILRDYYKRRHA